MVAWCARRAGEVPLPARAAATSGSGSTWPPPAGTRFPRRPRGKRLWRLQNCSSLRRAGAQDQEKRLANTLLSTCPRFGTNDLPLGAAAFFFRAAAAAGMVGVAAYVRDAASGTCT